MDPNTALRVLRSAVEDFHNQKAYSPESWEAAAAALGAVANLDEWLSRGGSLPNGWDQEVNRLNTYGRNKFGDAWWPGEDD